MSDDLARRHIEAAKHRLVEKAGRGDMEGVALEAKTITELQRRLGDSASPDDLKIDLSGTSGAGTTRGTPGSDPAAEISRKKSKLESDAELFHKMSGREQITLFREDPARFKEMADAAREMGMRKLMGL